MMWPSSLQWEHLGGSHGYSTFTLKVAPLCRTNSRTEGKGLVASTSTFTWATERLDRFFVHSSISFGTPRASVIQDNPSLVIKSKGTPIR